MAPISPAQPLTTSPEAAFFLAPELTLHRQYEALRACFVEGRPSQEVARRFGYTPGSFRVLCHQFRHDPAMRATFFAPDRRSASASPAHDRVRDLAVARRKRNLSVYDIQRALAEAGHTISITALSTLLKEEGFARLPRRRDDQRPQTIRPEAAACADVRLLSLTPRSFRTRVGGLFLFVPLMRSIRLAEVVARAELPGSEMIPAQQAVRTLLALKLIGKQRQSHVMDLVEDRGIALFAGLNVVPKRSYLAAYSSRIDHDDHLRLMAAWSDEVHQAGLPHGHSFDVDFHTIAANSGCEPKAQHYVSRRSRFVDFWQRQTGKVPGELVFDSQLTTYANLSELNRRDIHFMTLRRRSRKMLAQIFSRPASAWQRITLPALTRTFRTPKVLDERIRLKGYEGELRQVTVIELGHEEPTVLLSNDFEVSCVALVTRYAQRMLLENGLAEAIAFFHLDALASMVGLKVDFDLQITLMASSLYRLMAGRIGREYARAQAKTLFRQLLDVGATVEVGEADVVVTLDKRAHNPYLVASRLAEQPTPMPWFGGKLLHIRFS
jgi:hypothetical protein